MDHLTSLCLHLTSRLASCEIRLLLLRDSAQNLSQQPSQKWKQSKMVMESTRLLLLLSLLIYHRQLPYLLRHLLLLLLHICFILQLRLYHLLSFSLRTVLCVLQEEEQERIFNQLLLLLQPLLHLLDLQPDQSSTVITTAFSLPNLKAYYHLDLTTML